MAAMAALVGWWAVGPAQAENENFSNKPAPQLFNADCTGAGCHKSPQGLGKGQSQSGLAGFLREHYTNSRESAASLAAYILKMPAGPEKPDPRAARASTARSSPEPGASWFDPEPGSPRLPPQQRPQGEKPARSAARPTDAKADAKPAKPEASPAKPAEAKPGDEPGAAAAATPEPPAEHATPADRRRQHTAQPAEAKPTANARNPRGRQPTAAAAPAEPAPAAPAAPPQFDIFD